MSFQEFNAKFNRQYEENDSWRLLRAKNAPLILAFLADLFKEDSDVAFGKARVALDAELKRCRESGIWQTDTNAITYLREWVQSGWLRDLDDHLNKTDACEIALRFCQGLDQRENSATASHLRIVQEAVRDLAIAISPNANERVTLLKSRQDEIQLEIDALNAGVVTQLTEDEQHERVKEIYQLSSVLTGDFRRVEDEIRQMDQKLRVEIIGSDSTRGEILLGVLEKEHLLANTDAGRAFEGFFQLLCDQNRNMEFREQLRSILSQPVSRHLSQQQRNFLGKLMRELSKESERVFKVRRRTEESLRSYIESGTHLESKVIDQLLSTLEHHAVEFREAGINSRTELNIDLPSGSVKITSPESMKLRVPDEQFDTSNVQEHINSNNPSDEMLECLDAVKIIEVAQNMKSVLISEGPLTIKGISQFQPIKTGLEELVAFLRVAKAIGATEMENKESIEVCDKKGGRFNALVPMYMLHANQFPERIDEMAI